MADVVSASSARSRPLRPAGGAATIRDIRCRVFRVAADDGVAMSFAPLTHRVRFVVELELDDGTVGRGESWVNFPDWAWRERLATVRYGVRPLLVGKDGSDPGAVHARLLHRLDRLGRQWGAPGPVRQAVSGVDAALWDALARRQGRSIVDLLGGARHTSFVAYGSSIGPTDAVATAERCGKLGLRAVKIKVGFGRGNDVRAVRDARRVLGDRVSLFADANQAWSRGEATEMAAILRDEGVEWLEEPVTGDRLGDLEAVAAAGALPLATGENLYGIEAFARYAASPAVAILQPDVTKCGGITEYLAVARVAAGHGTTVNPHLYNGAIAVASTLQVAAAVASTRLVEWDVRANPLRRAVSHLLRDDGTVTLPTGPGNGVDIDLDELSELEVDV